MFSNAFTWQDLEPVFKADIIKKKMKDHTYVVNAILIGKSVKCTKSIPGGVGMLIF